MKKTNTFKPTVLIRFSEIAIKGSKTRKWLTQRLINHIKYILKLKNIKDFEVINDYSRLFIESNSSELVSEYVSTLVPGIASLSIVYESNTEIEEIKKMIDSLFRERLRKAKSFAVRVRRTGRHTFTSVELAATLGEYILNSNSDIQLKVNLTNPEYILHLDVRGEITYIFDSIESGLGGLPVGCQGNVLVLISGEEEDITNIMQLYKRGVNTLIYSNKRECEISKEFLEKTEKIITLQPKMSKLHQKIFYASNDLDIHEILNYYNGFDCKGIAVSKSIFEEISKIIPVTIPIFVPNLVTTQE